MVILFYLLKPRDEGTVIKEIRRLESLLAGQIENKAFFT